MSEGKMQELVPVLVLGYLSEDTSNFKKIEDVLAKDTEGDKRWEVVSLPNLAPTSECLLNGGMPAFFNDVIKMIYDCEIILFLDGWERSPNCVLWHTIADRCKSQVEFIDDSFEGIAQ